VDTLSVITSLIKAEPKKTKQLDDSYFRINAYTTKFLIAFRN
jgi:hypothetical protein